MAATISIPGGFSKLLPGAAAGASFRSDKPGHLVFGDDGHLHGSLSSENGASGAVCSRQGALSDAMVRDL